MTPGSIISLSGAPGGEDQDKENMAHSRSAILVNLNDQAVKELQQTSQQGKVIQLLGGTTPVCV